MAATPTRRPTVSHCFDGAVLALGLGLFAWAVVAMFRHGTQGPGVEWLAIPLIAIIARFPMLLDRGAGGIEVGFDSCVLMFLLCTVPPAQAIVLWSLGVIVTQLPSDKRPASKSFNIGVGLVGGGVSAAIITGLRGELGSPQELLAVALGAAGYFAVDFLVSGISVALEAHSSLRAQLVQPGSLIAVACFVPFDSLGYLGAVVNRTSPWWVLCLLAVPLVTLLVATRAVTRGGEHARRLSVLFAAAVRAQTLSEPRQITDALARDARQLLGLKTRDVVLREAPPASGEIGARLRDGRRDRWLVAPSQLRARSTSQADQTALEALAAVSSDAFARLRLGEDMTHLARHDLLTNLPNRGLLRDRLEHALLMSRRRGSSLALLFCDLDGFKPVNDRFGHAAGDAVLVDVAQRLRDCVRESDTVARLGGDEFAILLEDVRPTEVDAACERVLAALSTGALVAGHQVPLSASIGIAFGETGSSAEHLLRNADMAMYQAKARGKNRYVQYERSLGRARVQRLELLESLRAAVAAEDLRLVYQPVVQVDTGRIVGVEALARWTSKGMSVAPDVFIPMAEESGLVVALGDLVLDLAAADAQRLVAARGGPLTIGINISAQQLREPAFVAKVEETMQKMPGANLVLELTERDYVSHQAPDRDAMTYLSERGVAFAIDDFGVGFSSIGYLQDMPVRIIKTDASFSSAIDRDERSCALLRSITLMGQALELDVLVEGIERTEQLEHLRDHVGAPFAQGYLLHRPMPVAQVVEALRADTAPVAVADAVTAGTPA
ncbi:MAG TPA: EAL domain-containing protein [Nocardioidaceae bacterium]|nr:EAL domain-containing protein [Nocardioidaceae bacterium]